MDIDYIKNMMVYDFSIEKFREAQNFVRENLSYDEMKILNKDVDDAKRIISLNVIEQKFNY